MKTLPLRTTLFAAWLLLPTVPEAEGQSWTQTAGGCRDADGNSLTVEYGRDKVGNDSVYTRTLHNPLIVVEGFDPSNESRAYHYFQKAKDFFSTATKAGADVFLLDFADGGADLVANAAVVRSATQLVIAERTSDTPVRVAGVSMGGLIARQTLTTGSGLDVSHYASLDAPHQGAAIDRYLLQWIKDPPVDIPVGNSIVSGAVRKLRRRLNTMAAKQLLVYNPYSNGEHHALMAQLRGAGYPTGMTNIGVTFSRDAGVVPGTSKWASIQFGFRLWHFYRSANEHIGKGESYLPRSSTDSRFIHHRVDATFVPYNSALDVGYSQFDITLSANVDMHHDVFPDELIEPLLHWLNIKSFPLRVSASGDVTRCEGQSGRWTVGKVRGGSGHYEYRWEHRDTCPSGGATGASLTCGEWHSVCAGKDSCEMKSLSADRSPHLIRVTDQYARTLTPAKDTVSVVVEKIYANLDRQHVAAEIGAGSIALDNYPHPFNPATVIRFSLPEAGFVRLQVYDITGRAVALLAEGFFSAGQQSVAFDGASLPSGTCFYTRRTDTGVETRSMLLLK